MKFYPLTIKDIQRETADCVSIAFDVPESLSSEFKFTQGQYLTLRTFINGEDVRRSYSICTSPGENELRVAVKQVENGLFSTFANQTLRKQDVLDVMPPMGHFYSNLSADNQKKYVFIAAGSGITPIISNMKTVLETEPRSLCTLIYGNQKVKTIIFKEALEALKNQHIGRVQIFNMLSREHTESDLMNGRITASKLEKLFRHIPTLEKGDEYFICGPNEMIESARTALKEKGIAEDKIHFEMFNVPAQTSTKEIITDAVESMATITMDGLTLTVPVHLGQTVLEAAQEFGMDMPYACKGGVCCTCRAKLQEGKVEMTANYALTKEEVQQGFILTCQAIPKTDSITIDFDIK